MVADLSTTDQFDNAEGSIDKQRMDALNALAQFGRRGLEQAVQAKQSISSSPALDPYNKINQATTDMVGRENQAQQTVQGNFYDQAREAVPLYRQNAIDITTQYRNAYDERQRVAAHQLAMEQANQAQAAAMIAAAQAAAMPRPPVVADAGVAPPATAVTLPGVESVTNVSQAAAMLPTLTPGSPEYLSLITRFPELSRNSVGGGMKIT